MASRRWRIAHAAGITTEQQNSIKQALSPARQHAYFAVELAEVVDKVSSDLEQDTGWDTTFCDAFTTCAYTV
jgi:hypothetical protein